MSVIPIPPMPVRFMLLTTEPVPVEVNALKALIRPPIEFLWLRSMTQDVVLRSSLNTELKLTHGRVYMSLFMNPESSDKQSLYISYMPAGGFDLEYMNLMREALDRRYHIGRRQFIPARINSLEDEITSSVLGFAKLFNGHVSSIGHGKTTIDYSVPANALEPVAFREFFFRQVRRTIRLVT